MCRRGGRLASRRSPTTGCRALHLIRRLIRRRLKFKPSRHGSLTSSFGADGRNVQQGCAPFGAAGSLPAEPLMKNAPTKRRGHPVLAFVRPTRRLATSHKGDEGLYRSPARRGRHMSPASVQGIAAGVRRQVRESRIRQWEKHNWSVGGCIGGQACRDPVVLGSGFCVLGSCSGSVRVHVQRSVPGSWFLVPCS